jgi:hypothetical protein
VVGLDQRKRGPDLRHERANRLLHRKRR